jgi:nitroreductase
MEHPDLVAFEALVARRRTNLRIDTSRPVPAALVARLCHAAAWAPNHHRTWPWRFAAIEGEARVQLGELVAADLRRRGAKPEKIAKAETKYLRAPLMLAVGVAHDPQDDAVRRAEDRDAVAAATQNLLLAATAAGLASYWGSGEVLELAEVRALCRFGAADELIGLIYLGYPLGDVASPARPAPILHFVSDRSTQLHDFRDLSPSGQGD